MTIFMLSVCNRESSRVVFVPFEKAGTSSATIDDTDLIKKLGVAGDSVPLFIKLGKRITHILSHTFSC